MSNVIGLRNVGWRFAGLGCEDQVTGEDMGTDAGYLNHYKVVEVTALFSQ